MAARKEILSDLSSKIADGNVREAYRTFEELPVVDQIAVSIAPGVGDVLAAYEVKEFGSRAQTNIEDKDYLGAAGNTGLSALSGISLIPLFRFLRGARGVTKPATKLADAPPPQKPPTREPAQLAPPKITEEVELPEVLPFNTKPAKDLAYKTTQDYLPLQSKARKFLHGHYKKIDPEINELSPQDWIKTLTNPNNEIPLGELRILNVLDELNEIHPKFAKEVAKKENNKISKQGLDSFMQDQQMDALQVRNVPPGQLQDPDTSFVNDAVKRSQRQKAYFVRGAGEQRTRKMHLRNLEMVNPNADDVLDNTAQTISGNKAYVMDGTGVTYPMGRYEARAGNLFDESGTEVSEYIKDALDDLGIESTDKFVDIFRVQSDFAKEVGRSDNFINPKTQAAITKKLLQYNKLTEELNPFLATNPSKSGNANLIAKVLEDVYELPVPGLQFKLSPEDMQKYTGRPFTESLDKTTEDIFYTMKDGKQTYIDVPNNPEALSKAYFEDMTKGPGGFADFKNGVTILKKAVIPKVNDFGSGKYKIDPYFGTSTTNEMVLPVRANVLEAYKSGADGVHIGNRQAIKEGANPDTKEGRRVLEKYDRGEKEIQKILNELGLGNKKKELTTRITGTDTEYDGTYLKFTDELKDAIEKQGINAFKDGGAVGDIPSEKELAKISQTKLDEIETELKDILGFNIYENLFKGGTLDELYQNYNASKDIKENIIDDTESKLRESLKIPYKDEIIDILQSDNPKENLEQRLDVFGTKQIDRALQGLNLPIDIKKTQEGIEFGKDIYAGDKFNVDFAGYKPDDGDFRGDIDFRYKDRGRFGNIDIQSTLDELGDIDTRARYGYSKGPFDVRAQKYPGRDATGDISYTLRNIDVGRNQKIGVKTIVDQLKRVKFNLDYMYNNPKTGGFIDANLGLSNRGGPELNIGFGREF